MDELELQSFDLGEDGGGRQLIFASKPISPTEHYVLTLGNGPKNEEQAPEQPTEEQTGKGLGRQLFDSISKLTKKNQQPEQQEETSNIKLRCFKLSKPEGKKFFVEEYLDPKLISDVARFMGAGQHDHEKDL